MRAVRQAIGAGHDADGRRQPEMGPRRAAEAARRARGVRALVARGAAAPGRHRRRIASSASARQSRSRSASTSTRRTRSATTWSQRRRRRRAGRRLPRRRHHALARGGGARERPWATRLPACWRPDAGTSAPRPGDPRTAGMLEVIPIWEKGRSVHQVRLEHGLCLRAARAGRLDELTRPGDSNATGHELKRQTAGADDEGLSQRSCCFRKRRCTCPMAASWSSRWARSAAGSRTSRRRRHSAHARGKDRAAERACA